MVDSTPDQGYRSLHPGMGQAVAERTILRKKENGEWENWGDVAHRVALGNSLLAPKQDQKKEYELLNKHIAQASLLMSGRHLQHGDENQPSRNMEVFTNCATSANSFILFYLMVIFIFRFCCFSCRYDANDFIIFFIRFIDSIYFIDLLNFHKHFSTLFS